jgi:hypothetical protein
MSISSAEVTTSKAKDGVMSREQAYCSVCFKNLTAGKSSHDRHMHHDEAVSWASGGTLDTKEGVCTRCGKPGVVTFNKTSADA